MESPIRIFIVDDHPFFRQGVKFFLSSLQDLKLIGEASNGVQALEYLSSCEVDVILMDLNMTGMDGLQTTQALLKGNPDLRILILSSFGSEDKIQNALSIGAAGYCLKDAPPDELVTAIRAVASGGTYLGRGISPKVLTLGSPQEPIRPDEQGDLLKSLTQREMDVLILLTRGLSNKEIAEALFVSEKTVKTHVANLLQKLSVKTRTQAALLASSQGLC